MLQKFVYPKINNNLIICDNSLEIIKKNCQNIVFKPFKNYVTTWN